MEQKSQSRGHGDVRGAMTEHPGPQSSEGRGPGNRVAPIAILSILTSIIPYPSNLRRSLAQLAPQLATSFSLCRHYSALETELTGLQRRRPPAAGFGALAIDGRPISTHPNLVNFTYLPSEDITGQSSMAGSITSPSECSHLSRSAAGSPTGTPGAEHGALGFSTDKRSMAPSPLQVGGDSYFSTKQRPTAARVDTSSGSGVSRPRRSSQENSPIDKRQKRLPPGITQSQSSGEVESASDKVGRSTDEPSSGSIRHNRGASNDRRDMSLDARDDASDHAGHALTSDPGPKRTRQNATHQQQQQYRHTVLHSYGADFSTTFPSLPPSSNIAGRGPSTPSRSGSNSGGSTSAADMPPPSDRLKGLILDSLPAHVFVAMPQSGEIVWVNSRYLSYRGLTVGDLVADPWGSIHPDDRQQYLKAWSHCLRTGEQFSRTVRIRRFDGCYRWFYARAVASRDKRGVMLQFLGSYMDIHDQHIAELKAARQEEIEASEAKHRLLANLIPQIIFTATENEGITFANEQWLSYTGQSFEDSLGLGFIEHVHPEDLAKCRLPSDRPPTPVPPRDEGNRARDQDSASSDSHSTTTLQPSKGATSYSTGLRGIHNALSRNNSSSSSSSTDIPTADLTALARRGIIKVATDSNGRQSYTTEVRLRSKTGEYRWHLIRCVGIDNIDFGNGASSYFGSATDINDHKILETKLKEAMEEKGRFLSNMSHEIRTPLIGISGMVSFLQDTTLNEEQRDYANTIQTSANSLLMIINDILDLSKVAAGMMKLNHEWFHTRSLIEDVNELVSTMAVAKRLELNYVVEADVPAWVKGDKIRIRQILLNVIGNAIKFTAVGEVFSRCRVCAGPDSGLAGNEIMLEFAIVDTGRGFTVEEADLMFKPFSQIDGSSTRQHGGSGLGLVISRQLVELHGGTMQGTAVPGQGSTFTFTAKFALPTAEDYPDVATTPPNTLRHHSSSETRVPAARNPRSEAAVVPHGEPKISPSPDPEFTSPAPASSASSDPSIHSARSHFSDISSVSSVNTGLAHFSQAARASGQDLAQMKLEMPSERSSPGTTPTPESTGLGNPPEGLRPPMYSILIICPQTHSREATTQHIEMTLPKDVPHQITALATVEEAQRLIGGKSIVFTHMVINVGPPEDVLALLDQISKSTDLGRSTILILSDAVQRQGVMKLAAATEHAKMLSENRVTFINKPLRPSRFAVIFDPGQMRDLSVDRNRSTAQRMVETQKASYQEVEKRMGNKGYEVLLVEDNPVNQKVLTKYLKKVGVAVDIAVDGEECTEKVFAKVPGRYSLILCDLHMPRKDGYQACREIRKWERQHDLSGIPIIALSANVMSDVQEKCIAAGFNDYIAKPVDFINLSRVMSKFF